VQEVDDVHPQSVSHHQEVAELDLGAGFHALDRRPVQAARLGEHFLSHVLVEASRADAVTGRAAGCGHPLGQFGWHPSNALPIKIICQQQI